MPSPRFARLMLAGAIPLGWVLSLTACGNIRRIEECNTVTRRITEGSVVLKEFDRSKDYESQAAKIEEFDKSVASVQVTLPELKTFVDEYRKLLADITTYARDQKDSSKYDELNRRAEALSKRERDFVERLNKYCRGD